MAKKYKFNLKTHKIQVILDRILFLRVIRRMHGRFWGIFGLMMLSVALVICFIILPDLRTLDTAFSDFGTDIRTAPIFTAGVFAAAYGLWRWRNYLVRTSKNSGLVTLLITLIILGLYMVVFMPIGWSETAERIHYFGFGMAGIAMLATVVVDLLLRKTKKGKNYKKWQIIRIFSLLLIITGLIIAMMSAEKFGAKLNYSLVGETLVLVGFGTWVLTKTYQGEGARSSLSKILNKIVIVD